MDRVGLLCMCRLHFKIQWGRVLGQLYTKVEGPISERDQWPSPMDVPWIPETAQLGCEIRAKRGIVLAVCGNRVCHVRFLHMLCVMHGDRVRGSCALG